MGRSARAGRNAWIRYDLPTPLMPSTLQIAPRDNALPMNRLLFRACMCALLLLRLSSTKIEQLGGHFRERHRAQGIQKGLRKKGLQYLKPGCRPRAKTLQERGRDDHLIGSEQPITAEDQKSQMVQFFFQFFAIPLV